ncbi:hypothetical protein B0J12DRAFT_748630 [Macrophomina phaseolina]|uniref:Uncharacterized protein n=1 Tax=Macrophomina phaseolina TaxID=35725 RepID=A0ABQ8GUE1_9PEZI|nr:hypothetical protein B0J12DRAFT_748630 [Macrophomina phaseolina]
MEGISSGTRGRWAVANQLVRVEKEGSRWGEMETGAEFPIRSAFVTVKPGSQDDFEGTIGSMLDGLTGEERKELYVSVLFADTDPTHHPNWEDPWVHKVIDAAATYNVSDHGSAKLQKAKSDRNFYVKGIP